MILADSNIIIYAAAGSYPNVTRWFIENSPAVSAISMVEVLGYHNLSLATHNTSDFKWIETIKLIDPVA